MAIFCAYVGSDLYATAFGGFYLNYARCAIFARVRVWKVGAGSAYDYRNCF
jgi:hypothetical protein